ncbi:MAG: hypothetical protein AAFQ53_17265, partial [Bacteroidota bacterium]
MFHPESLLIRKMNGVRVCLAGRVKWKWLRRVVMIRLGPRIDAVAFLVLAFLFCWAAVAVPSVDKLFPFLEDSSAADPGAYLAAYRAGQWTAGYLALLVSLRAGFLLCDSRRERKQGWGWPVIYAVLCACVCGVVWKSASTVLVRASQQGGSGLGMATDGW